MLRSWEPVWLFGMSSKIGQHSQHTENLSLGFVSHLCLRQGTHVACLDAIQRLLMKRIGQLPTLQLCQGCFNSMYRAQWFKHGTLIAWQPVLVASLASAGAPNAVAMHHKHSRPHCLISVPPVHTGGTSASSHVLRVSHLNCWALYTYNEFSQSEISLVCL